MLDLMRSDIAAISAESSTETVARALAALTPSDLVRLKRLAQLRARLLPGLEWEELLNEALLRALDGSRRWPEGVPLLSFIAGIIAACSTVGRSNAGVSLSARWQPVRLR